MFTRPLDKPFDPRRLSALAGLVRLADGKLPATGRSTPLPALDGFPGLAPTLRDVLARFGDVKPGTPLCGLGVPGGVRGDVSVPPGASFEERTHRGAAGTLAGRLYVPSGFAGRALPLVVMLHGCTQSPEDFAAGTRMNEVAEEIGLLVAYPRQTPGANAQKCWNWFEAAAQMRDRGEPSLIAGLTRDIVETSPVDASRVYVAGLSAGGAAAAVMGQCYPDLYAAVGVHSGLAAGAARDMPGAFAAMRGGGRPAAGRAVPTVVFHGDADRTVHPGNGEQVVAQVRGGAVLRSETTRGRSEGGLDYTRTVESDPAGLPMVEHWRLHGAGHAWSGGSTAGSYTEPRGPDASREMLKFFLRHHLVAA